MNWFIRAEFNTKRVRIEYYYDNCARSLELDIPIPTELYKRVKHIIGSNHNFTYIAGEGDMTKGYEVNFNPMKPFIRDIILRCIKKKHITSMVQVILAPELEARTDFYRHILTWIGEQKEA